MSAPTANTERSRETPRALLQRLLATSEGLPAFPTEVDEELLDQVADRVGAPEEAQERTARGYAESQLALVRRHLQQVAPALPADLQQKVLDEDFCVATLVPMAELNAHALRAGNGGWLIVLNEGVMRLVYKIARSVSRHFSFEDPREMPKDREPVDPQHTAELIATVFDWYLTTGLPIGPDFPVTRSQMGLASRLTTEAEIFVVSHELAHHVLGHLELGTRAGMVAGTRVDELAVGHREELAADLTGLTMRLNAVTSGDPKDYAVAYAGIELFFHTVDLLEAYSAAPESETHPPAANRLATIRAQMAATVDEEHRRVVMDLSSAIDVLLDDALRAVVLDPERRARQQARRPELERLLDRLLDAHVRPGADGAASFVQKLSAEIYNFPPAVMADVLAERLEAFKHEVDTRPEPARLDAMARLRLLAVFVLTSMTLRSAVSERTALLDG